jgi:hypothetical protein
MCLYPSSCTVLSIFRYGLIVSAVRFNEIVPREPALGRSDGSFAISISSYARVGVASKIDWKLPRP